AAKKKHDEQRKHMQAFVDRFKAKASKAKQAQSRMKMIEKLKPIAAMSDNGVAPFNFPSPERTFNPPMMRFENTAVGYEEGLPILKGINLRMDPDDRIALLGANGNGKSTFAKLLAHKLEKMGGEFFHHKKVVVGYFAQHQMDELDETLTPYQVIRALMIGATEAQVRSRVAQIGFDLDRANTKCENLSGGEKARMLFAIATFHKPNLLILDEPTNHLDIDSRQALILALNEYEGAVILISHDRHLVEASADILWLVNNGTVEVYDGDMDDYRNLLLASRKTEKSAKKAKVKVKDKNDTLKDKRKKLAQARAKLAPLKQNITTSEANVGKLERKLAKITKALADPKLFTDFPPAKAAGISRLHGETKVLLGEWEAKWLKFLDDYEQAKTFLAENEEV
ncbi:MAG: ABC-F family ATP-binding cassette domain-containing protein, partial [Rhizobiales bacterium]|nr:ABC-F family ATP-binding cassette domain-containing protein [Hyphomicrobiales bacterium]